jgi:L-threonylcarbamoyladenylate synthase
MNAQVQAPTPANLRRLAAALRRGDLVALPTETVYGLAANALDARACRRIFRAKGRPAGDPLIVHVRDLAQAAEVAEINGAARKLAAAFWPGPLTMVLPKKAAVPDVVTSGLSSVAVRAPAHRLFQKMLRLAGVPLAAPSANPFGYISPTRAEHVQESLGGRIRHILDGGPCRFGVESTIVDLRRPEHPRLLRLGVLSASQLAAVLGVRVTSPRVGAPPQGPVVAPGLMKRHYSPKAELRLVRRIPAPVAGSANRTAASLYFCKPTAAQARKGAVFWLSTDGSVVSAARRLYGVLRKIDRLGFSRVVAETAPADAGPLGEVINDRLRRAAAKR